MFNKHKVLEIAGSDKYYWSLREEFNENYSGKNYDFITIH
jgi:hypothetical protein